MSPSSTLDSSRDNAAIDTREQWEAESPFVDRLMLDRPPRVRRAATSGAPAVSPFVMESPFVSAYEAGDDVEGPSPQTAELYRIVRELRDDEFDDALSQLRTEAYDLLAPRLEGEEDMSEYEIEQFYEAHFGPLVRETGRLLDRMAAEMERHELEALTEPEIDQLLEPFEPEATGLSPSFEGFLKKVFTKAKTAVKKVASAARKGVVKAVKTVGKIATAPVAIVLKKLKQLVKLLLQKVLKSAIGKLPEPLQDAARQAAQKLFGDKVAKTEDVEESELLAYEGAADGGVGVEDTDDEIGYLQDEMDLEIANLVLADDETRQDVAIADYETRARRVGTAPYVRLRRARRRFVRELEALGDGQDATPVVERFLPAILPALKLGLELIGRKRVVSTLGGRRSAKRVQPAWPRSATAPSFLPGQRRSSAIGSADVAALAGP
jgi:hypothetical protein